MFPGETAQSASTTYELDLDISISVQTRALTYFKADALTCCHQEKRGVIGDCNDQELEHLLMSLTWHGSSLIIPDLSQFLSDLCSSASSADLDQSRLIWCVHMLLQYAT